MPEVTDGVTHVNRFEVLRPQVVVAAPSKAPPPPWWASAAAVVVLVLVGIGLRAVALATDRDLWIDEAMLALNLVGRSPAGLLEPLDWNQGAPIGFLLLAKASITAFGVSEFGLRLVPFLSSLLGLVGFAWLAPRVLPRPAAVLAVGLFSVSPYLISYAAECKQYATDAAATVGLFAAAIGLLQGRGGAWRWAGLALAGALAVWLSHPAAFVLAGIGTALLADAAWKADRARLLAAAATVAAWLVSFGIAYLLFLRHLGANAFLLAYWEGHFLPWPPASPGDLAWLADHYFAPFEYPGGLGGTEIRAGGIAAVLFVVGVWGLAKERWSLALAVVLPPAFALAASGLHRYPFAGRLLLFLVPLLVLGVARGAWMVAASLRAVQPVAAASLLGVLVAAPCLETYQQLRHPERCEQLPAVLAAVRADWQPGDQLYVYYGAAPAFAFYTSAEPFPADATTIGTDARGNRLRYRDDVATFAGHERVWLVFSHRHQHEETILTAYAEALGRCDRSVHATGAAAYRFDFSTPQRHR